ncbi:MAG: hypothetical protein HYV45_03330 [Candidatus Moranbacteria bacterium]|nr:hypothetical protein [Candidatus Moranbacteria bacterium]
MDEETIKKLEICEKKIDAVYVSVEKTRRYFLWTLVLTLVMFFLPLVGLIFVIPFFLNIFSGLLGM